MLIKGILPIMVAFIFLIMYGGNASAKEPIPQPSEERSQTETPPAEKELLGKPQFCATSQVACYMAPCTIPIAMLIPSGIFGNYNFHGDDRDGSFSGGLRFGIASAHPGRNDFGADLTFSRVNLTGDTAEDDRRIDCFNLNFQYGYKLSERFLTLLELGPGHYNSDQQEDAIGIRGAVGLLTHLGGQFYLDVSSNYHYLFNDEKTDFFESRVGVDYKGF